MGPRCPSMNPARRILITDDDAALRQSLAKQLQLHEEFDIGEAASGGGLTPVITFTSLTCDSSLADFQPARAISYGEVRASTARDRAPSPPSHNRRANLDDWRRNGVPDSPRGLTIRRRRPVKQTPMCHEAKRRATYGQDDGTVLSDMTREYWRASRVLRSRAIDRPCDRTPAQRFLVTPAADRKHVMKGQLP